MSIAQKRAWYAQREVDVEASVGALKAQQVRKELAAQIYVHASSKRRSHKHANVSVGVALRGIGKPFKFCHAERALAPRRQLPLAIPTTHPITRELLVEATDFVSPTPAFAFAIA